MRVNPRTAQGLATKLRVVPENALALTLGG
jgi:hypothetical protein